MSLKHLLGGYKNVGIGRMTDIGHAELWRTPANVDVQPTSPLLASAYFCLGRGAAQGLNLSGDATDMASRQ